MPTATEAAVRSECNLSKLKADDLLTPHLVSAELEIQDLLGVDRYVALAAPSSPYAAADQERLVKAEAILAGAIALPFLNTATSGSGITAAQATGENGAETRYLSQQQVMAKVAEFRALAMRILRRYVPGVEEVDSGLSIGGLRLTSVGGAP